MRPSSPVLPSPPEAWAPATRLARAVTAPVERFLAVQAASGVVLLIAAVVALVWANSPWAHTYAELWHTPFGLTVGPWSFTRDLHWWVNDALMVVFFVVVGLEIRREVHAGELSELRRAALPLVAALGGMLAPAAIYLALNYGRPSAVGWGVPMATDIAFAVGVLALLGQRVAPALRVLLLALAVVDDLGAIVVIAIFYAGGVSVAGLLVAAGGIAAILVLQAFGVRAVWVYVVAGLVAWAGTYASGVHPTIAGVVAGLVTPVVPWLGRDRLLATMEEAGATVRARAAAGQSELHDVIEDVTRAAREAVSPVERLQHGLHHAVAFGVMPLFALANAGVPLGGADLSGDGWRVFVGVSVGLVVGKTVGVVGLSWVLAQTGLVRPPRGVSWTAVSVVGMVAGIGFTMALFVAQLAFPPGVLLETAKLGVLAGSAVAGVFGLLWGRLVLAPVFDPLAAPSAADAESSADV